MMHDVSSRTPMPLEHSREQGSVLVRDDRMRIEGCGLPLFKEALAGAARGQVQQQAAREPHAIGAETAEGQHAARDARSLQPRAQRRRQLVEQVAAQMGHGVAPRLRRAVRQRQQIGAVEGGALVDQARAIGAVLGGEGHGRDR